MPEKNVFVFITDHNLEDHCGVTSLFVAEALSKIEGNIVLFVEKASSLASPFRQALVRRKLSRCGKIKELSPTLYGYTPYLRLPFDRMSRVLSHLNQKSLARQIKSALRRLGLLSQRVTVVTFTYNSGLTLQDLQGVATRSVYYVLDDWKEFSLMMSSRESIVRDETATFRSADLVITTSEHLSQISRKSADTVLTITNGVNTKAFESVSAHPEMRAFSRPVVGFVGKIEEWVDLELIRRLSESCPHLDFVLIGPASVDTAVLASLPNVHLLGSRPSAQIPGFISGMTIGIIPFRNVEMVQSVSPLKLYEYLAAGLPVVTSPMDGVVGLEHLDVFVEHEPEGFRQRICALAADADGYAARAETRRAFARENSWERKAQRFLEVLAAHGRQ